MGRGDMGDPDLALLERWCGGDTTAGNLLFHRHFSTLYKFFEHKVIGEVELAAPYLKGKNIGITGSNGKTTTTTLVGKVFSDAGVPTLVGGNIGLPVIDLGVTLMASSRLRVRCEGREARAAASL